MVIGDADKQLNAIPIFIISCILEREDPPVVAFKPSTDDLLDSIQQIIGSVKDLVSGFLKVQNKMYEVYRTKRQEILERMEREKNPMRKAMEEDEIKISDTASYYRIVDDSDIQKYSKKIIENLRKVCIDVTKDSKNDKWTNTTLFWESSRKEKYIISIIEANWTNISSLRDHIESNNTISERVERIKSSKPIGCIILDDSAFKQALSEIVILSQNAFMSYLQERCVAELR